MATSRMRSLRRERTKCLTAMRRFWATAAAVLTLATSSVLIAQDGKRTEKTVTITEGDLKVVFRDQSKSLSGVASLFHQKHAPDVDAYIRAGLNFEHIISGHKNPNNK